MPFERGQGRGRMWFATTYLRDDKIVPADEAFVRWASRVLQWVRRNWVPRYDNYTYESPTAQTMR